MKYKKNYILIAIVLFLIIGLATLAQQFFFKENAGDNHQIIDTKNEYKKLMNQFFDSGVSQNISGIIRLYDGENPTSLKEEQPFRFCKGSGSKFYSSLSYQQTLCDGHLAVMLDTINKIMLVSSVRGDTLDARSKAIDKIQLGKLFGDTALSGISGIVSENGNERTIQFQNDGTPEINSYSIIYEKSSYKIKASEIIWWKNGTAKLDSTKNNQVWITKIEYQFDKEPPIDVNKKMESIISIQGDKIQPAAAYKQYDIRTGN